MAVTANQIVKRQGRDGKIRSAGVAAAKRLYEGTAAFLDAGGDLTDVKVDATTVFAGIVRQEADNTSGADSDIEAELWTDGDFVLTVASLTDADKGAGIYASDNYTFTKTATANPQIGVLVDVIDASTGVVSIRGLGEPVS